MISSRVIIKTLPLILESLAFDDNRWWSIGKDAKSIVEICE